MGNTLTDKQKNQLKRNLRFASQHMAKVKATDIPIVKMIIIHNGKIILKKYREKEVLTPGEEYVTKLNNSLIALMDNFRDLELIELFLAERLKVKTINRKEVTDPEYIRYHMENYFIRVHKIKDQVCILLNNFFKLGHYENSWLEKNMLKDEFLKATSLTIYIKYCNEIFRQLRSIRNQIAHRSNLSTSDLGMLDGILLSNSISKKMRNTYFIYKEAQIRLFVFVSEKNRKILHEAIISLLIILTQAYVKDFESHSGIKIAHNIKAMMKNKRRPKV